MLRASTAAFVLAAALPFQAQGQAAVGPRLYSFHSVAAPHAPPLPRQVPGDAWRRATPGGRVLAYSGIGLVVGVAGGALVGPVLTNSACLSWKKDASNQTSCLDAFFTPREHLRAAVILGGVGTVVGAITGLIGRP